MGKLFIVLGGFYGSDEDYEHVASADTYEGALEELDLYQKNDPIVEYDFYTISEEG